MNKYDRQIRLWGVNGQRRLVNSSVVIINLTPSSAETLKNLVLAGVHSFSIVDPLQVTESDVGSNLLYGQSALNQSRAKVYAAQMQDMNPDLQSFTTHEVDPYAQANSDLLNTIISASTLVVVDENDGDKFSLIKTLCDKHRVKYIRIENYGQIFRIKVHGYDHFVLDQPLNRDYDDYRLDMPFDELKNYLDSIDLNALDEYQYYHTPYVVIIYKMLQEFKQKNTEFDKNNFKQKQAFRKYILDEDRFKNPDSNENIHEGCKFYYKALTQIQLDESLVTFTKVQDLRNKDDKLFAIALKCLVDFKNTYGDYPLTNKISDMKSDTKNYLTLKGIYRSKFESDYDKFMKLFEPLVRQLNLNIESDTQYLNEFVRSLLKNLKMLKYIDYNEDKSEKYVESLMNYSFMDATSVPLAVAFDVVSRNGGIADVGAYSQTVLQGSVDFDHSVCQRYVEEIHRFKNEKQIASIAALVGGVASQEAVKLVTMVFIPLNNTFIYNGIDCTSVSYVM